MSNEAPNRYIERWNAFLGNCQEIVASASPLMASGHLTRINGLVMEATGLKLPLGSSCRIFPIGGAPVEADTDILLGDTIGEMGATVGSTRWASGGM